MAKTKDFTQDELDFLFKKIERGTILTEKESIDLGELYLDYNSVITNNIQVIYKHTNSLNDKFFKELKNKIIDALQNSDNFDFSFYDDCGTLNLYNSRKETDDEYMNRIKLSGRYELNREKSRQRRNIKKETRKVIFEKTEKKKIRKEQEYPRPIRNIGFHNFHDFALRFPPPENDFPF